MSCLPVAAINNSAGIIRQWVGYPSPVPCMAYPLTTARPAYPELTVGQGWRIRSHHRMYFPKSEISSANPSDEVHDRVEDGIAINVVARHNRLPYPALPHPALLCNPIPEISGTFPEEHRSSGPEMGVYPYTTGVAGRPGRGVVVHRKKREVFSFTPPARHRSRCRSTTRRPPASCTRVSGRTRCARQPCP
jgi:hypothetical protein